MFMWLASYASYSLQGGLIQSKMQNWGFSSWVTLNLALYKILILKVLNFNTSTWISRNLSVVELSKMAFAITFVVRGYHVFKDIWAAEIGSELPCFVEPHNWEDRYAVAVMDDTSIVGHIPRKISYICYIFLLHSGSIICRVTGPKQYSRDLEWGGLDVPCEYRFYSKKKRVKVTRKLLELASFPTKDIIEVKANATAPSTSSKDTSKDTTES